MKPIKIIVTAMLTIFASNLLAGNSQLLDIASIEARENGYHAVYPRDGVIPDEGCVYDDRAILSETSVGGKTMLEVALAALVNKNSVIIRVEGCASIVPTDTQNTAPLITKIQMYRSRY